MRFLVIRPGPGFSVQDVQAGWVEALRNAGQHVVDYNTDDRLAFFGLALMPTAEEGKFRRALDSAEKIIELAVDGVYGAVMKTRPHVMVVVSAFFTPPQMLEVVRAAGVKVVIVHTESPYEDERQLALAAHADLNLVNDPTNLDAFKWLAPTEYFCHAYRPSVHHPGSVDPVYACDVGFVGTGFPSRVEFFERMAPHLQGVDLKLAGNWALVQEGSPLAPYVIDGDGDGSGFDNENTAALYRSAKVGLNLYRREAHEHDSADGYAMGPREVEMAACQLPFVRDPRPESDEVFSFLPVFSSPEEAAEQIRWLIAHEDQRVALADKARSAIADRTFDAHAARLLRLLDT